MKKILAATAGALLIAGFAGAQTTDATAPTQGTPPNTNTPAPAPSDMSASPSTTSSTTTSDPSAMMAAPVDKPMAGAANEPTSSTDSTTTTTKTKMKHKKSPK